ncbi:hypothetical protein BS47DRAFT_1365699 [Hydnum rufescens UP504]|uniref:Uncharacterized protein n=1 Tax=Hydnum rufescens UP504 TaxID=1448309 RepID=A0A9P6AN63_9AGAM|nr:hypothetical protein BS47DRAFT_1365699 [Hydnum rufescens UP504]
MQTLPSEIERADIDPTMCRTYLKKPTGGTLCTAPMLWNEKECENGWMVTYVYLKQSILSTGVKSNGFTWNTLGKICEKWQKTINFLKISRTSSTVYLSANYWGARGDRRKGGKGKDDGHKLSARNDYDEGHHKCIAFDGQDGLWVKECRCRRGHYNSANVPSVPVYLDRLCSLYLGWALVNSMPYRSLSPEFWLSPTVHRIVVA